MSNPFDEISPNPFDSNDFDNDYQLHEDITEDVDLGAPPKRNALEKFQKSSRRRAEEQQDEEVVDDESSEETPSNNKTSDEAEVEEEATPKSKKKSTGQNSSEETPSKTIPIKDKVIMILMAMFFIWFLASVFTSSVDNWTNVSNPIEKTNKYLRKIDTMDVEGALDNILSFGG